MKRILMSFALGFLGISAGLAADRTGGSGVYRAAIGDTAFFRAPVIPTIPTTVPGGTKSTSKAPDVKTYTVENCMNDVMGCVTNTLPDGINAMFNADMRNSVINGIGLCGTQIDKCVSMAVRTDGNKAYYVRNDVWLDFNSRVIQPTYYAFVLQKTGLTPNQAENTCWLLDKNVYGSSFSAVNAADGITTEYSNVVKPYNGLSPDGTIKAAPMGSTVNNAGAVDAQRGHYARWDATTGDCLVRIAAYNKGTLITNDWLFGGLGDKRPAEVWKKAGDAFVCNKDVFGFEIMRDTQTNAVVYAGGGAVLGAGIGALIGLGAEDKYEKTIDSSLDPAKCIDDKYRKLLAYALINLQASDKMDSFSAGDCERYINKVIQNRSTPTMTPSESAVTGKMKEMNDSLVGKGTSTLIGTGVGAGIGLAAGGIVTAITAFVESNNISCHVGDGLDQIGFEKKSRVKSLKEYYVEWNLRLPDTVMPQQTVTECTTWNTACGTIANIADCALATVNYKPIGATVSTQVATACIVSGNACVVNNPIAVSYGACP